MTDDRRTQRYSLLRQDFGLLRWTSVTGLLLIVIPSAGCTAGNAYLFSITAPQPVWASPPTEMPDGAMLPVPTATETLPAAEAIPQTPTITPTLTVVDAVYLPFEYVS